MTVTDFPIRVPSNDQIYSLVSDLTALANDVSDHLGQLDAAIDSKVTSGNPTSVTSITCTGTGTFRQVTITPASGTWTGQLLLDSINGLRLSYNIAHFYSLPEGRSWTSSVPIYIPRSGVEGNTAINWNYLFDPSTTTPGRLVGLEKTVAAIPTTYVTKATYNAAIGALNTEIANLKKDVAKKAWSVTGDPHKVYFAGTADKAKDTDLWDDYEFDIGSSQYLHIPAGYNGSFTIKHRKMKRLPLVFAMATNDGGNVSIICTVQTIGYESSTIGYRNINESVSEDTYIRWLVIG